MQINLNTDNFRPADCNGSDTAGHIIYPIQEYIVKSNMDEISSTTIFYDLCLKPWVLVEFLSHARLQRETNTKHANICVHKGQKNHIIIPGIRSISESECGPVINSNNRDNKSRLDSGCTPLDHGLSQSIHYEINSHLKLLNTDDL